MPAPRRDNVVDLMTALKQSLEGSDEKAKGAPRRVSKTRKAS